MRQQSRAQNQRVLPRFLPPDAQDRLLDNVTALGAPGSRFASEHMPDSGGFEAVEPRMREEMQTLAERWREQSFDLDLTELMYPGERHDVGEYLYRRGWQTEAVSTAELFAANGLAPLSGEDNLQAAFVFGYLTATASSQPTPTGFPDLRGGILGPAALGNRRVRPA